MLKTWGAEFLDDHDFRAVHVTDADIPDSVNVVIDCKC
jgi:hypothetical protein